MTPPEFRDISAAQDPTARVGGVALELIRRGDETILGNSYQQVPLRMLPPFSFDGEAAALLYLITLTTGLLDGDAHLFRVTARSDTRMVLTGQSATRVHPAVNSFATQQWDVEVENNAILVVLPGPVIPFQGSRLYQRARVQLAPNARVIWGDIWLAGRYERGTLSERFAFERIVQDLEVRRNDKLIYRDRFRWDGPWTEQDAGWYFGGHLASASLFVGGPIPEILPQPCASVRRAVFPLDSGETCIRWCGSPMRVTDDFVRVALSIAGQWTGGANAPPWLLSSSELSPNHWFSTTPVAEHSPEAERQSRANEILKL